MSPGAEHHIRFSLALARSIRAGVKRETRRLAWRRGSDVFASRVATRFQHVRAGEILRAYTGARDEPGHAFAVLRATEVRREPLACLRHDDAILEGVRAVPSLLGTVWSAVPDDPRMAADHPVRAFKLLWNSLHPPGERFGDNPEVVVILFNLVEAIGPEP